MLLYSLTQDDNLEIGTTASLNGTFYKSTSDSGEYFDWGKRRHSVETPEENLGITLVGRHDFNPDGTGVDVVIQDSGLQIDHSRI